MEMVRARHANSALPPYSLDHGNPHSRKGENGI
jgi:hypothetical protein